MKFDRETMIGIVICAVILFGWDPFMRAMGWMPAKDAPSQYNVICACLLFNYEKAFYSYPHIFILYSIFHPFLNT